MPVRKCLVWGEDAGIKTQQHFGRTHLIFHGRNFCADEDEGLYSFFSIFFFPTDIVLTEQNHE
jgi:hypothetical protein